MGGKMPSVCPPGASQSEDAIQVQVNRRGNEYDVSCRVNTTDSALVNTEVNRIFLELYPRSAPAQIDRAFGDLTTMYRGHRPGYHACDTAYHDIQHVLEVTLAMARLIDGYERARMGLEPLDAAMFRLGVITALFHDCGYIRTLDDRQHKNGGELTLTHVSRGALSQGLPAQDRHGRGSRCRRLADPLHRLRDPGLRNQCAVSWLQAARQPARLGGHHRADVGPLLSGKMPRPALSGIPRWRHRPQASSGRRRRSPVRIGRGPGEENPAFLPGREPAPQRGPRWRSQVRAGPLRRAAPIPGGAHEEHRLRANHRR